MGLLQVFYINIAFLILRFVRGYTNEELEGLHYSIIIHAITLACQVGVTLIQIGCTYNAEAIADIVNQLLTFNVINGKFRRNAIHEMPRLENVL